MVIPNWQWAGATDRRARSHRGVVEGRHAIATPTTELASPTPTLTTFSLQIDALGIHFYSLRKTTEALRRLMQQLPRGERGPANGDLDTALAESPRTALVTVTNWQDDGTRGSTDVILAGGQRQLHVFLRDANHPARLAAQGAGRRRGAHAHRTTARARDVSPMGQALDRIDERLERWIPPQPTLFAGSASLDGLRRPLIYERAPGAALRLLECRR